MQLRNRRLLIPFSILLTIVDACRTKNTSINYIQTRLLELNYNTLYLGIGSTGMINLDFLSTITYIINKGVSSLYFQHFVKGNINHYDIEIYKGQNLTLG